MGVFGGLGPLAPTQADDPSLNKLLSLEETSEVEDLPSGQTHQAKHGEDTEVEDTRAGGFVGISHFLLALLHEGEIFNDGFGEVLEPAEVHFQRLQFLCLCNIFIIACFYPVLDI